MVWCDGGSWLGCIDDSIVILKQSSAHMIDAVCDGLIGLNCDPDHGGMDFTVFALNLDFLPCVLPHHCRLRPASPICSIACGVPEVAEPTYAPVIQVVEHLEPGAERDQQVLELQADVLWAEAVEERLSEHSNHAELSAFHGEVSSGLLVNLGLAEASEDSMQEATDNTDASQSNGACTLNEKVHILRFGSPPAGGDGLQQFRATLLEGPHLRSCREALQDIGCSCELHGGALMFVKPEQAKDVEFALKNKDLHPYHIFVGESMEYLVDEILANFSFRTRPKMNPDAHGRSELNFDCFKTNPADSSSPKNTIDQLRSAHSSNSNLSRAKLRV